MSYICTFTITARDRTFLVSGLAVQPAVEPREDMIGMTPVSACQTADISLVESIYLVSHTHLQHFHEQKWTKWIRTGNCRSILPRIGKSRLNM